MNLLHSNTQETGCSSIFMVEFLFFMIFVIFSIIVYPFNRSLSYLLLILITLIYLILNLIISYLSLKQRYLSITSLISIILGMSYIIYTSYLLIDSSTEGFSPFFKTSIDLLIYFRPYFTALSILFICNLCVKKPTFNRFSTLFIIAVIFIGAIISIINLNGFIKASIIITLYLISFLYLYKQQLLLNKSDLISVVLSFILIIMNEIIIILSDYYDLGVLYHIILNITFVFPLYLLYSTQIQSFIFSLKTIVPSQQHLYKLNCDLMNKFFTFKDNEVQNLRTEVDTKDGLYKQLFDFAPDALLIFINNNITYINQATLSLLGASNEYEIINTPIWRFIHPDSVPLVKSICKSVINSKADTMVDEFQLISLDKKIKDVRVSSTSLCFNKNDYILLSLHDLSLDRAHKRIQSQLEENIANEKSKVEFFANISHDLKTPVNVIYSAAQLQDLCATEHEYDKVNMYNNVIKQNCLRLQKLLNDLLDITKLDANCFKSCPRPCNIIHVVENIVESVASYVMQKNIRILFDTNVEEKFVLADPDLIERILLNLISNSIKYGKDKGHIWVTLYDEGKHLIVSIKDDGMGIPKSEVPYIFKRFHKVPDHTNPITNGNGIGLSLVHSIVEVLGGNIFCLSQEGNGSEFIFILPMIPCKDEYNDTTAEYIACSQSESQLNIELSDT